MKPGGAIARSIKEAEKSGWKLSGVCYRSYEHWMRKQVASSSTTFSGKTQTGEGGMADGLSFGSPAYVSRRWRIFRHAAGRTIKRKPRQQMLAGFI